MIGRPTINTSFDEFFSTVYSSDSVNCEDLQVDVLHPDLFEISTTQSEVEDILVNLYANKATGVDGIPARILKSCARELSMPLTKLFNLSLSLGVVPMTWKRANTVHQFLKTMPRRMLRTIDPSPYYRS